MYTYGIQVARHLCMPSSQVAPFWWLSFSTVVVFLAHAMLCPVSHCCDAFFPWTSRRVFIALVLVALFLHGFQLSPSVEHLVHHRRPSSGVIVIPCACGAINAPPIHLLIFRSSHPCRGPHIVRRNRFPFTCAASIIRVAIFVDCHTSDPLINTFFSGPVVVSGLGSSFPCVSPGSIA